MQLLRRGGGAGEPEEPGVRETPADDTSDPRIRCPKCAWEPRRVDTWTCSCRHEWNTFDTGGVCPICQRQWLDTQCPHCDTWSPHLAWYVIDDASTGSH